MTDGNENSSNYSIGWTAINGMETYYLPVLVFVGGLGNCLSIYVVFASKMRYNSSSMYLAALALSDTGFLISILVAWLGIFNIHIMNEDGLCQFLVYWPFVCSFLSAWFVVAFTVERFVAVCYPLRRQWMCTVYRAKSLISSIAVVGLTLFSPMLVYTGPRAWRDDAGKRICQIDEGWEDLAGVVNYVDTAVTFALPLLIIIVLNSLIIRAVRRVDSARSSLKARTAIAESQPSVNQTRVTKMLLIVSTVFFCFNLPAYVMRIYAFLQLQKDGTETELEVLVQKACNLLFDTNFGISFGLYCASGQNFRAAVKQLFHCRYCRRRTTLLRIRLAKRSSSNQANRYGTETLRTSGSTPRDERTATIRDKPWKDSFELRPYTTKSTLPETKTEIEEYCASAVNTNDASSYSIKIHHSRDSSNG